MITNILGAVPAVTLTAAVSIASAVVVAFRALWRWFSPPDDPRVMFVDPDTVPIERVDGQER
jgi:hypothetical protein